MHSRSFDTTDKFEIGRYELTLVVSRPAFLAIGVMNAFLYSDGKWPAASERLNSSVKYGATKWTTCFITNFGIGLAADDLSGSCRTALMTSSTLTDEKAANETPGRMQLHVGGTTPLVLDRTFDTFSAKNRLVSIESLAGMRPRPRRLSTDFHNDRGSAWSASIFLDQNSTLLRWRSWRYWRRWLYHAS